jgi:beta-galactosidase beta subunit
MKLNNFADDLVATDKIIKDLKRNISDSKSMVNDEIREGLSKIYKKAKLERDEALKDLIRHQNLADEAYNKFANSSLEESSQYHHQWISNVQMVIEDKERIERSEKELEAIKRVYRLEFG